MATICFPNYPQGELDSLADALESLKNETSTIPISALCNLAQGNLVDNIFRQNYIFSNSRITESDMKNAYGVSHGINFHMVHENIPEDKLPILCYNADGKHMILVSKPVR